MSLESTKSLRKGSIRLDVLQFLFLSVVILPIVHLAVANQTVGSEKIDRIASGQDVHVGEYPFLVAIFNREEKDKKARDQICVGTLLSKWKVLTACHCLVSYGYINPPKHELKEAWRISLVAGTTDIYPAFAKAYGRSRLLENANFRRAKKLNVHPKCFRNATYVEYDFGMITVIWPFCLIPHFIDVMPIRLGALRDVPRRHAECVTLGWGYHYDEGYGDENPHLLKKIQINILGPEECAQRVYDVTKFGPNGPDLTNPEAHVCVVGQNEGTSAGPGDSGGPLVCGNDQIKLLLGTLIGGVGEGKVGDKDTPALYANLDSGYKWMERAIALDAHKERSSANSNSGYHLLAALNLMLTIGYFNAQ